MNPINNTSPPSSSTNYEAEDVRKLHNEINQIVNQRYLIVTAAITLFGLFVNASLTVLKGTEIDAKSQRGVIIPILFLIILTLLFSYSKVLTKQMIIFRQYLLLSKKSFWEEDIEAYKTDKEVNLGKKYSGYSNAFKIIFIILGGLISTFPIVKVILNNDDIYKCSIYLTLILFLGYWLFIEMSDRLIASKKEEESIKTIWTKVFDRKNSSGPSIQD